MLLRFSVSAGRHPGRADVADAATRHSVDVAWARDGIDIGRLPGSAIELPFATVSARHARIFRQNDRLWVEDLGSANGTCLGARRLTRGVAMPLAAGEILGIADIEVRFDGELPSQLCPPEGSTATLARRLAAEIFAACPPAEAARLVVVDGPGCGRELALLPLGRPLRVGQGEGCDLILHDHSVAGEHLVVERDSGGITLRALGPQVTVQGRELVGSCPLHDGDVVRVGKTHLRLSDPEDCYLEQMRSDGDGNPESVSQPSSWMASSAAGAHPSDSPLAALSRSDPPLASGKAARLPTIARAVALLALLSLVALALTLAFGG